MRMELAEFDFVIEYIQGSDNVVADALSRIDFNDIKNIPEQNSQILAVTRSMAQPSRQVGSNLESVSAPLPGYVRSAHCLTNNDERYIPKFVSTFRKRCKGYDRV